MKLLVTAGPTREPIDPVRYLGNRSSGKMGYAIAAQGVKAGHQVVLISGPVSISPPCGVQLISVETSDQMHDAVHEEADAADLIVMCAAVADFKPARVLPQKLKKEGKRSLTLELTQTRDILQSLLERDVRAKVVGFAAETNDLAQNARRKLREKGCALIIANDVTQKRIGFGSDENALTLYFANGEIREFARAPKTELAARLIEIFATLVNN